MYSRAYLEITNICNRSCAFCPGTRRAPRMMTVSEFRLLAGKIRPFTDYLYLHVMGEPLLHPELGTFLHIAKALGFRVVLTTNGTLLSQRGNVLLGADAPHKVHISLHSFEANGHDGFTQYVRSCAGFARAANAAGIIVNLRLWNLDGAESAGLNARNSEILAILHEVFPQPWADTTWGQRLDARVFLEYGERFEWPELTAETRGERGFCHALRSQFAVLCDGSVVPCCLDHEGDMTLGNLFTEEREAILSSPAACEIRDGFTARRRAHPLCRTCGYASRFDK